MNGFLNLLKPPGMTSSDAVVRIRKTLSGEKVGHAGTLDPEAAGVLPIMIGKASRLFDLLVEKQKTYIAQIAFGISTDSQDAEGKILENTGRVPAAQALAEVLPRFVGDILQVPPAFSALKVGGKTAYTLAREGQAPVLAARPARIDAIDLLDMDTDSARLRVVCGKGVYIRTLCHDIGQALGCGAHMRYLLRTQTGWFEGKDSVTLEEWLEAADKASLLAAMDAPLAHVPRAVVDARYLSGCLNGTIPADFLHIDEAAFTGAPVRIYCGETFAGVGRWRDGALKFQAMLLERP